MDFSGAMGVRWGYQSGDGYTAFPNALLDVMSELTLSPGARMLLLLLVRHTYDPEDCTCTKGCRSLGRQLGVTAPTAGRWRNELKRAGLVKVETWKDSDGLYHSVTDWSEAASKVMKHLDEHRGEYTPANTGSTPANTGGNADEHRGIRQRTGGSRDTDTPVYASVSQRRSEGSSRSSRSPKGEEGADASAVPDPCFQQGEKEIETTWLDSKAAQAIEQGMSITDFHREMKGYPTDLVRDAFRRASTSQAVAAR